MRFNHFFLSENDESRAKIRSGSFSKTNSFHSAIKLTFYFTQHSLKYAPLALIIQEEYISEPEPGKFVHVKEQRMTEWPVEFLNRPKGCIDTITDFFVEDAPINRLEILLRLV